MIIQKKHIAHALMLLGVIAVLGTVTVSSYNISPGEMAYQKLWLGRMAIVFVGCSLISVCLDKKGNAFYLSVIWSLIILGGMEAVWGMRQIYGLTISNHSLYTLTGSFYNPGPYSGYLAMVFPVCLNEWLGLKKIGNRTWIEQGKYYGTSGVLLLILCVLPAGMSRSAWMAALVSGVWVYGMHFSWGNRLRGIMEKYRKRVFPVIIAGGMVLLMTGYAFFQLKADSANGRLLLWKMSVRAIAEEPVWGHGIGNFASAYGMAQENYFAGGKYSDKEELVAGSPEYAFNEYLQVGVDYGVFFLGSCIAGNQLLPMERNNRKKAKRMCRPHLRIGLCFFILSNADSGICHSILFFIGCLCSRIFTNIYFTFYYYDCVVGKLLLEI